MGLQVGLNKGSEDLSVFPEIMKEGVAAPATHNLHCFDGQPMEQVEESGPDTYAMPLKRFKASLPSC